MEAFDVLIANNLIKETSKYSFNLNLTDNQANFLSSINQIYKDGCSSKRDYEYKESIYKKYKEDFFVPNPEDDPKRSYKERCEIKEVKKRLNQKSRY